MAGPEGRNAESHGSKYSYSYIERQRDPPSTIKIG